MTRTLSPDRTGPRACAVGVTDAPGAEATAVIDLTEIDGATAAAPPAKARPHRLLQAPIRLKDQLLGEIDRLVLEPVAARGSWLSCSSLAVGGAAIVVILGWVQMRHPRVIEHLATVRAAQPLRVELLRLPLSIFAPAPHLPMWGAVAQVVVALWLAELNLGRKRTLALVALFHTTSTLAGRALLQQGGNVVMALSVAERLARSRDSGPSAVVVGVCVYLGVQRKAPLLSAVLWIAMILELIFLPDLAGVEHLAAMAFAFMVAVPLTRRVRARDRQSARTPRRSASRRERPSLPAPVGAGSSGA